MKRSTKKPLIILAIVAAVALLALWLYRRGQDETDTSGTVKSTPKSTNGDADESEDTSDDTTVQTLNRTVVGELVAVSRPVRQVAYNPDLLASYVEYDDVVQPAVVQLRTDTPTRTTGGSRTAGDTAASRVVTAGTALRTPIA